MVTAGEGDPRGDPAGIRALRPQLIISCGADWTRNTQEVEYPYIRNIYRLFRAESSIENFHLAGEEHDYGPSKRAAAYEFLAKHLDLSRANIDESRISIEKQETMHVFDAEHPMPDRALTTSEAISRELIGR